MPSRSINLRDVTTQRIPSVWTAWARLAGPVVQFSMTGSLPAWWRAKKTTSAATDAGSRTPTASPGNLPKRLPKRRVPTKSFRYVNTPETRSAAATSRVCCKALRTNASGNVSASTSAGPVALGGRFQVSGTGCAPSPEPVSRPSASAQSSPKLSATWSERKPNRSSISKAMSMRSRLSSPI